MKPYTKERQLRVLRAVKKRLQKNNDEFICCAITAIERSLRLNQTPNDERAIAYGIYTLRPKRITVEDLIAGIAWWNLTKSANKKRIDLVTKRIKQLTHG